MPPKSSPKIVDVSGFKPSPGMTFYEALQMVATGKSVARIGWEEGFYVYLYHNGHLSLHKPDNNTYDLIVSFEDMAGEDWILYDA